MGRQCGDKQAGGDSVKRCSESKPAPHGGPAARDATCPLTHFANMIDNCLDYASAAKAQGRAIVGILCEYTPRELILAAGAVPVCLCGGDVGTISAAERHLPANLCPLIKSTYGYHVLASNPFLELADLVVAETTCDGKKKMYELMGRSRRMYVLELPQKQDDPDAMRHWVAEVGKLKAALEAAFGVRIDDARLREAIRLMNRERALRRGLAELMKSQRPPLTGRELLGFKSSISGIHADMEQYEKAHLLFSGCQGNREPDGRIRVLMTGVPMVHGTERVLDIIEQNGGLVVCVDNCTGLKPILEDVDEGAADPLFAIAEKYFHLPCSVMTPNDRRLAVLRRLIGEYRPQCVVELVWQACLTYDVEAYHIRELVEKEMSLPYLRITTDYSPSDSASIALRVQAMFETVGGLARSV